VWRERWDGLDGERNRGAQQLGLSHDHHDMHDLQFMHPLGDIITYYTHLHLPARDIRPHISTMNELQSKTSRHHSSSDRPSTVKLQIPSPQPWRDSNRKTHSIHKSCSWLFLSLSSNLISSLSVPHHTPRVQRPHLLRIPKTHTPPRLDQSTSSLSGPLASDWFEASFTKRARHETHEGEAESRVVVCKLL